MTTPGHDQFPVPSSLSIDQGNHLSDLEIERIMTCYETEIARRTHGPQLEGIESASLREALRSDPDVILVDVSNEAGEMVKWPLFVPVTHHIDYSKKFFDEHYTSPAYFLSLPPYDSIEGFLGSPEAFAPYAERLKDEGAIIAYDYIGGTDNETLIPAFIGEIMESGELNDITPPSKLDDIEYGLPKVVHYEGYIEPVNMPEEPADNVMAALEQMVVDGRIESEPGQGVAYLTAEKLRDNNGALLEQIWNIYDDQFNTLTEDHPSLQKQPREELERMLLGEGAVNIAYMDEGKVAGLLYFVHNMEQCVWLNKDFYDERYPEEKGWLSYYPGIVVAKDKARQSLGYAQAMIACLADAVEASGEKMIVTCQCTNVSMTYIPKITANVINAHPKLRMKTNEHGEAFTPTAEYNYRVMQIS